MAGSSILTIRFVERRMSRCIRRLTGLMYHYGGNGRRARTRRDVSLRWWKNDPTLAAWAVWTLIQPYSYGTRAPIAPRGCQLNRLTRRRAGRDCGHHGGQAWARNLSFS